MSAYLSLPGSFAMLAGAASGGALLLLGPPRTVRQCVFSKRPTSAPLFAVAVGVVAVASLVACLAVGRTLVGIAVTVAGLGVATLGRRQRARTAAMRTAASVAEVCDALAADLSAGLPPSVALERSVAGHRDLASLAATARVGGEIAASLRERASRPGSEDLRLVAAAWQVADASGASLADGLRRAAVGIHERQRTRRIVESELSAGRATARLMAALPVLLGVAGAGLGADPLAFLLGPMIGQWCLLGGVLLSVAGMLWLERIAAPAR